MEQKQSNVIEKPKANKSKPKPTNSTKHLPKFKVFLLNDKVNDFRKVVDAVYKLTPLSKEDSIEKVTEAHKTGMSLLLVTHKERAELYQEQFHAYVPPIQVRIEADT